MAAGRVLVVASQKGGVGKTTLSLNTAFALARRGWRTLLIDADPQGSIGYSIQGSLHRQTGLVEVLEGSADLDRAVVDTRLPELQLLPLGELAPIAAFGWSASLQDGQALGALFDAARDRYEMILVDTPPTMGGVTVGALRQADHVIAPLQAEPLAARSVRQLLDVVGALREEGSPVELAGLVLTMLQSRLGSSLAVAEESWRLFPPELVFDSTVPRDPTFVDASAAGVPVALLHRRPPAVAAVFDRIAAELETRIGLEGEDDQAIPLLA